MNLDIKRVNERIDRLRWLTGQWEAGPKPYTYDERINEIRTSLELLITDLDRALAETVSRITQVAELTADGRHWRNLAEGWARAADAAQQPAEFYKDYSESTMRAMQALKDKAEKERDALLRGEYICKQCGLRKDAEHEEPTF